MRRLTTTLCFFFLVGCHYITIGGKDIEDTGGGGAGEGGQGGMASCTTPADCPGEDTTCRARTCEEGTCGVMDAERGEACSEDDGAVCDGAGTCVGCNEAGDCASDAYCKAQACVPHLADGAACGAEDVCASGFCVSGRCCDSACDASCTACDAALTGGADGMCLPVLAGGSPANMCMADEQCDGCGACEDVDQHWSALYGNDVGVTQYPVAMHIIDCGGIAIAGNFDGTIDLAGGNPFTAPDTHSDAFVARVAFDGTHVWSRSFTGGQTQRIGGLAVNSLGNTLVYGDFLGPTSFDGGGTTHPTNGSWQIFLAEYDGNGNHVRSSVFGGPSSQHGSSLFIDTQDNILVGGAYLSPAGDGLTFGGPQLPTSGSLSGYVAKLGPTGDYVWDADFPSATMFVRNLATTSDGTVWGAGGFEQFANFRDGNGNVPATGEEGFIVKLDPTDGSTLLKVIVAGSGDQRVSELEIDDDDGIYVAGYFEDTISVAGGPTLSAGAGLGTFVAKITSNGAHVWSKSYAATTIVPWDIVARGGQVAIVGGYEGVVNLGGSDLAYTGSAGDRNLFTLVLDADDGTHIYSRGDGDELDQVGTAVGLDASGRLIIGGMSDGTVDYGDGALISSGSRDLLLLQRTP